jgi:hypothetical protein
MRLLFTLSLSLSLLILPKLSYTQARLVLNNDIYINIENSAYLVIDNSNANALTTLGTGGNILSEDETDVIKWNIDATSGKYIIPWTTVSNIKIPFTMDITIPGSAGGDVIFSTYETSTDMNTPYPSAVTNMNYNSVDKSLFVVDRFWHVDARSYTTFPAGRMDFSYDPAANEIGGTNTINENNLLAQRFNTTLGHWEAYVLLGINDAANDHVMSVPFTPTVFFQDWILVDNTNPLPVTLTNFEATCTDNKTRIDWNTETEINNQYFIIEKSYDGVSYFELETIDGAGNSNSPIGYSAIDNELYNGVIYYRLKQVDFDGKITYFKIVATNCSNNTNEEFNGYFSNNELTINYLSENPKEIFVELYDYQGKLILKNTLPPFSGRNKINLTKTLAKGLYILNLSSENSAKQIKLVK